MRKKAAEHELEIRHAFMLEDRWSSMLAAATALQLSPEPTAVECGYQNKVPEGLRPILLPTTSARFRRIALGHLSNVVDAEDAVQDAVLAALTHRSPVQGASADVYVASRRS